MQIGLQGDLLGVIDLSDDGPGAIAMMRFISFARGGLGCAFRGGGGSAESGDGRFQNYLLHFLSPSSLRDERLDTKTRVVDVNGISLDHGVQIDERGGQRKWELECDLRLQAV